VVLKEDAMEEEGDALVISMTVHLFLDGLGVLEMQAGYGQSQERTSLYKYIAYILLIYTFQVHYTIFFEVHNKTHFFSPRKNRSECTSVLKYFALGNNNQSKQHFSILTITYIYITVCIHVFRGFKDFPKFSSLFSVMTPEALLGWQRVRAAHVLACIGKQWAQIFSKHNSGETEMRKANVDYYMVNLTRSYALPIISIDIYRMSGYGVMWEKYGKDFSYDLCPRVKIFRRDQRKVTNLDTLKYIMRHNGEKDPYSKKHPCKSICCCYDIKVTDYHMAQMFLAEAVNGPTTQNGLPLFSWSHFNQTAHHGIPQTYNFTFITMQPLLFGSRDQAKTDSSLLQCMNSSLEDTGSRLGKHLSDFAS
uniref:Phospholipase B-like n=1 Tax=Cyprinus carpio TaxID=7962 RepID=A0A8C2F4Z4_CYPCA